MAKLSNTKYATFDINVWGARDVVRVGHNRALALEGDRRGNLQLIFRLHGHAIATLRLTRFGVTELELNPCGYHTPTTRAAMADAINLFGLWGNVSFAKGKFSVGIKAACTGTPLEWREADADTGVFKAWWAGPVGVARTHPDAQNLLAA